MAAWQQRQQQRGVGRGSVAYADNNCNGHDDDNDWLLICGGGGRGGGDQSSLNLMLKLLISVSWWK